MKFEVEVPDQIAEFLKAFNVDIQDYLEYSLVENFAADLEEFMGDPTVFIDLDPWIEKLREVPLLAEKLPKEGEVHE